MAIQEENVNFLYGYNQPHDGWVKFIHDRFYDIFKELKPHRDKIHLIYAGANFDYPFHARPKESIEEEIRALYKAGKTNFIFEDLDEGVSLTNILLITKMLDLIQDIISDIRIFYASGVHDAEKGYEEVCRIHNLDKKLCILSCGSQTVLTKKYLEFTKPYTPGLKTKKFLCFNREPRQHRIDLFEKLLHFDLVKDSFYSFNVDINLLSNIDYPNITLNSHILPLVLNMNDDRNNPVDITEDDLTYFEQSYFSVVTETLFYESSVLKSDRNKNYLNVPEVAPGIFPTEKIYKCIALNHPFIVLSTKGFLAELKNIGYKTFHPYIDESYDSIEDDHLRLALAVEEIVRLCNKSDDEMIEFTHHIKDIVEHNSCFFKNLSDVRITKNVLDLLK